MNDRYSQYTIIKSLDNPPRMLFWRMDDFLIMAALFFVGLFLGSIFVAFSGVFFKYIYGKLREKYPKGRLQHQFYWILPYETFIRFGKFKNLPPSHKRDFIL